MAKTYEDQDLNRALTVADMDNNIGMAARIRVPKTSEIVADHIRAQIVRGELGEGDFLPPEGQLMETLGISRPTLREAFRILEAENLISVVRGSRTGARVHAPSDELVSRYAGYVLQSIGTTIADLYQTRLAIEPSVVRWLSTKPEKEPVARLRAEIARLQELLDAGHHDEFMNSVNTFHLTLVSVSNLKSLAFMSRMMINLMARHQADYQKRHPQPHEQRQKSMSAALKSYEKLVGLIEAGKVEEAVAHWRLHLNNANLTWSGGEEATRVVDSLGQ